MSHLVLLPIKPITVNRAWQYSVSKGKIPRVIKRKSDDYLIFEKLVKNHLTGNEFFIEEDGPLSFKSVYSTSRIDLDNCFKAFMDILEVVYDFNDNRIDEIHARKVKVPKGSESIKFIITPYNCINPEVFELPKPIDYRTLKYNVFRIIVNIQDLFTPTEIYECLIKEFPSIYNTSTFLNLNNVKVVIQDLYASKKINRIVSEFDNTHDKYMYMLNQY